MSAKDSRRTHFHHTHSERWLKTCCKASTRNVQIKADYKMSEFRLFLFCVYVANINYEEKKGTLYKRVKRRNTGFPTTCMQNSLSYALASSFSLCYENSRVLFIAICICEVCSLDTQMLFRGSLCSTVCSNSA